MNRKMFFRTSNSLLFLVSVLTLAWHEFFVVAIGCCTAVIMGQNRFRARVATQLGRTMTLLTPLLITVVGGYVGMWVGVFRDDYNPDHRKFWDESIYRYARFIVGLLPVYFATLYFLGRWKYHYQDFVLRRDPQLRYFLKYGELPP